MKVVLWSLLKDPPGENKGTRDVKTRIANQRKNGPTLERGRTKLTEQYQVLRGTGNSMKEMRS